MTTKEALRRLIEELSDDQAERLLRALEDPTAPSPSPPSMTSR